jgi:hypothetical protein
VAVAAFAVHRSRLAIWSWNEPTPLVGGSLVVKKCKRCGQEVTAVTFRARRTSRGRNAAAVDGIAWQDSLGGFGCADFDGDEEVWRPHDPG